MSFSLWILPMYLKSISGTKAQSFLSSVDCFLLLAPCVHCSSWPQCHTPFLRLGERVGQMRHLGRNLERNSLSGAHNMLAALFPAHTHSPASQVLLHAHVLLFPLPERLFCHACHPPLSPSSLCSNVTSSERSSQITLFKLQPSYPLLTSDPHPSFISVHGTYCHLTHYIFS